MNKLLKRALCMVCITTILITCAACGKSEVQTNNGATAQPQATDTPQATPASQEPVKIKMYSTTNGFEVPSGNINEVPIMKVLQEKTNVILDLQLLDHSKYDELIRTKFASGDYPDVYLKWSIAGDLAVENDLVEDLTPYIEKYGPNLKKNIPQNTWKDVTWSNGAVLAIPCSPATYTGTSSIIYVRKDWMDKAGVTKLPETPDELLEMWKKFRDCDFNGNGIADEIPFSAREKYTWMGNLYSMWGLSENGYVYEGDKFMPSIVSANMKNALEFLTTAYKEKLLDSEVLTNSRTVWENKIIQNRVGSWNHVVGLASDWYIKLRDANGGKDVGVIAMPTPKSPDYNGPVGSPIAPFSTLRMVFKSAPEETKIAIVKMFDFLSTEEGEILSRYGIEGDTLTKDAAGNFSYDLAKHQSNQTLWFGPAFLTVQTDAVINMIKAKDPIEDTVRLQAISVAKNEGMPNLVVPMPAPKAAVENPSLYYQQDIIQGGLAQIITGEKPVSYYDEVVDKWMKAGGDKLIEETTTWYKSFYGK